MVDNTYPYGYNIPIGVWGIFSHPKVLLILWRMGWYVMPAAMQDLLVLGVLLGMTCVGMVLLLCFAPEDMDFSPEFPKMMDQN